MPPSSSGTDREQRRPERNRSSATDALADGPTRTRPGAAQERGAAGWRRREERGACSGGGCHEVQARAEQPAIHRPQAPAPSSGGAGRHAGRGHCPGRHRLGPDHGAGRRADRDLHHHGDGRQRHHQGDLGSRRDLRPGGQRHDLRRGRQRPRRRRGRQRFHPGRRRGRPGRRRQRQRPDVGRQRRCLPPERQRRATTRSTPGRPAA